MYSCQKIVKFLLFSIFIIRKIISYLTSPRQTQQIVNLPDVTKTNTTNCQLTWHHQDKHNKWSTLNVLVLLNLYQEPKNIKIVLVSVYFLLINHLFESNKYQCNCIYTQTWQKYGNALFRENMTTYILSEYLVVLPFPECLFY